MDVVELFEGQKLERDLEIARLEVLPNPKDWPVANERHIRFDPMGQFRLCAHPIEVLHEEHANEHNPETEFQAAVPECRREENSNHGLNLHLAARN